MLIQMGSAHPLHVADARPLLPLSPVFLDYRCSVSPSLLCHMSYDFHHSFSFHCHENFEGQYGVLSVLVSLSPSQSTRCFLSSLSLLPSILPGWLLIGKQAGRVSKLPSLVKANKTFEQPEEDEASVS